MLNLIIELSLIGGKKLKISKHYDLDEAEDEAKVMKQIKVVAHIFISISFLMAPYLANAEQGREKGQEAVLAAAFPFVHEQMPSAFRLMLLGGAGLGTDSGKLFKQNNHDGDSYYGSLLAGFGRGMFSFETGVMYLKAPMVAKLNNNIDDSSRVVLLASEYLGVPVYVKYNYIEKPLATFFVKAGVVPISLINSPPDKYASVGDNQSITPVDRDILTIIGFGGTAPLDDTTSAFVLDISAFYGSSAYNSRGDHNQGVLIGAGFSFDI
jgi:hypothetical protein